MVNFRTEGIKFILKNKAILKDWIVFTVNKGTFEQVKKGTTLLNARDCRVGTITFIFCSDEYLLKINQSYLNHDYYTDIITFDYSQEDSLKSTISKVGRRISGDLFISIDRVKENAKKFSKTFEEELYRVIIHGILHLLGYTDKTKIAKTEMTKQENYWLKDLRKRLPL